MRVRTVRSTPRTERIRHHSLMARFLDISLWIYVIGLVVWLVARGLIGDRSIFVSCLSFLGMWLFLPLPVFGAWAISDRQRVEAFLLLIPLTLFFWFYGPMLVPKRAQNTHQQESMSVVTFNLRCTNPDSQALLAVLSSTEADVFALQEVTARHEQQVHEALVERYPYNWHYRLAGLAIYSAYPIVERRIYLSQPWPVQSVVLNVNGRLVHVLNAHLARAGILQFLTTLRTGPMRALAAARAGQIALIEQAIDETGLPAVVACDGNMTNLTAGYAQITSTLQDAYREQGWGLGHTFLVPRGFEIQSSINLPVQRIDYMFHSAEIMVSDVQVIRGDSGSDHRPLWARFDLNPRRELGLVGEGATFSSSGEWEKAHDQY